MMEYNSQISIFRWQISYGCVDKVYVFFSNAIVTVDVMAIILHLRLVQGLN